MLRWKAMDRRLPGAVMLRAQRRPFICAVMKKRS